MDIRWEQRFDNFSKAVKLLKEIEILQLEDLSLLEKEGIIQRFEFTLALAWKTLKDKMEFDGMVLDIISPKMVIKEAFKAKYIDNVETWLDMIDDRNLLSHTYDYELLEEVIPTIKNSYTKILFELYESLKFQKI